MSARSDHWINAVLFQVVWFAAVLGAAHDAWWAGPIAVGVFAVYTLSGSSRVADELLLIGIAVAVGFVADSIWASTHLVVYASPLPSAHFAPIWILSLWANLALGLYHSLAFLQSRLAMAALFGAIGAPLSYYFAARTWHAVTLAEPLALTLLILAAGWAVITPLLVWSAGALARRSVQAAAVGGAYP